MKLAHWIPWHLVALAIAGYGPVKGPCPSNNSMIRSGNSMSPQEAAWVSSRHVKTDAAIQHYLNRVGVEYNATNFNSNNKSINVALAFSGGGLRAMLSGAGQMAALDNRSAFAAEAGLGGILQSASYVSGLSGGSWLLASLIFHDWPTIDEIVLQNAYNIWDYTAFNTFLNTSNPIDLLYNFALGKYEQTLERIAWWNVPFGKGIKNDLMLKKEAGFPVTITDAWGRILAHSLFRMGTDNWMEGATWSGIRQLSAFANHNMPFPIITALARRPHSLKYDLDSPIVEFNPYEMGSFDTSINTFHDIQYLGTSVSNGTTRGNCITGFDNAAFIMGTSSSLFNQFLNTLVCPKCNVLSTALKFIVKRILKHMSRHRLDVAWFDPNPFYASPHARSEHIVNSDTLYLMDGGMAGEIVPLSTISVKERELDVVFAFDNDGPDWPDGTSLINTYQRQFVYEGASTVCPYVPGQSTFMHHNLTAKPTFFGCNASNLTALTKDGVVPPIVVYIANRPYEFFSNTSTYKLTYSDNEKKGMVANGFNVASRGNMTTPPTVMAFAPKVHENSSVPGNATIPRDIRVPGNGTTPAPANSTIRDNANNSTISGTPLPHNATVPPPNTPPPPPNSPTPRNNQTAANSWQFCVGCAMVRRAEERNNIAQSEQCRKCFEYYCWDGRTHEAPSYNRPSNFTTDGLTNQPMTLNKQNAYIHQKNILRFLAGKYLPFLTSGLVQDGGSSKSNTTKT